MLAVLSRSLAIYLALSLSLCIALSRFIALSRSLSLYLALSLSLARSRALSLCLSHSLDSAPRLLSARDLSLIQVPLKPLTLILSSFLSKPKP